MKMQSYEKMWKMRKCENAKKPEKWENHTKSPLLVYIEAGFAGFIKKFNLNVQQNKIEW